MNTEELKTSLYNLSESGLDLKYFDSIGGGIGIILISLVIPILAFLLLFIESMIDKGVLSGKLKFYEYNTNKIEHKKYLKELNSKNQVYLSKNLSSDVPEEIINFKRDILLEIKYKTKQLIEKLYHYKFFEISLISISFLGFFGLFIAINNDERATKFYEKEFKQIKGYENLIITHKIKEINLIDKEGSSDKYYVIHYEDGGKLNSINYKGVLNINETGKNEIEIFNSDLYKSLKKDLKKENKKIDNLLDSYLEDSDLMNVSVSTDF